MTFPNEFRSPRAIYLRKSKWNWVLVRLLKLRCEEMTGYSTLQAAHSVHRNRMALGPLRHLIYSLIFSSFEDGQAEEIRGGRPWKGAAIPNDYLKIERTESARI
jgi:hypothetical protein